MIRNVVVHLANEQPLLADLFDMPGPGDLALVCTNLRTMNGTRPVFADDSSSFFVFALSFIRFVEIPPASQVEAGLDAETLEALSFAGPSDRGRVAAGPRPSSPPAVRPGDAKKPSTTPEPEPELEIDEDFLKRVRDI